MLGPVVEAVIASPNLEDAVGFYTTAFDLTVLEQSEQSVLLGVPSSPTGRVRLVAAEPVAAAGEIRLWDVGPRLLGIYSRDLERTARRVLFAGGRAQPIATYPYAGGVLRELTACGPDGIYWSVPEVGATHRPSPALELDSQRLHGELHVVGLVASDHDAMVRLFVDGGGLSVLFDNTMSGAATEQGVGLPPGAQLRVTMLLSQSQQPARLEILSFEGVTATDRTADTTGLRRLRFACDDVAATTAGLVGSGATRGTGPDPLLYGPDGVELELVGVSS